jgi:zinc and cadmium transporter
MVLWQIIGATALVSIVSLVGVLFLSLKQKNLDFVLAMLVSLSAGTFLGAAFLDLLPEALEGIDARSAFLFSLIGILAFFVTEKIITWHHHHVSHEHVKEKPVGYMNLIGDGVHNFFDGVAISAAFMASPALGIGTTIAVLIHEIPQEIGDFSLLLYSGFSRTKAIAFNLLSGVVAIFGGIAFYYASSTVANLQFYGLALASGMFIYMAAADIVPELHKETNPRNSLLQLAMMLIGIAIISAIVSFVE